MKERTLSRTAAGLVLSVMLVVAAACDNGEPSAVDEANARANQGRLFQFADEHLDADTLGSAVPADFAFVDANRNGYERHGNEWVTVSVEMEGPVPFARAIFYVHPDEQAAHAMFQRQSRLGPRLDIQGKRDVDAEPSSEALDVETRCHVRGGLVWCHAQRGQVYLVIQSSAGRAMARKLSPLERRSAARLLTGFAKYLRHQVPEE